MSQMPKYEVPKWVLILMNNLFDAERKLVSQGGQESALRNIAKMKDAFRDEGFFYEDPQGQKFKETRTDLEATICGDEVENLIVVEVMKPIIRWGDEEISKVVQKGIVLVESTGDEK